MGAGFVSKQIEYYNTCNVLFDTIKETKNIVKEIKDRFSIQEEIILSVLQSIVRRIKELIEKEKQLMIIMKKQSQLIGEDIYKLKWKEPELYKKHVDSIYETVILLRVIQKHNMKACSLIEQLNKHINETNDTYVVDKPNHDKKKTAFNVKIYSKAQTYLPVIDKLLEASEDQQQRTKDDEINATFKYEGGKPMNIEAKAAEMSDFLEDLFTNIIGNDRLKDLYSDVGTLEDKINDYKTIFDKNWSDYKILKPKAKMKPNVFKDKFDAADIDLRNSVQEMEMLCFKEVFPALKKTSKKIQEDVSNGKIKIIDNASLEHDIPSIEEDTKEITEPMGKAGDEPKSAFNSKVNRLNDWIDKASTMDDTVKKVENFYSKYGKYIVKGFKYLIGLITLL